MVERNIPSKLVTIRLTDKPCFNSEIKKEIEIEIAYTNRQGKSISKPSL